MRFISLALPSIMSLLLEKAATAPAPTAPISAQAVEAVLESSKSRIDNELFLYKTPTNSLVPSTVYRYAGFIAALRVMYRDGVNNKYFYVGDDSSNGRNYGLANIGAFLAQSMKETIQYDACDENSWDLVNGRYPLSNSCGQLGQSYQDYKCSQAEAHMECPIDRNMQITAVTNAKWYGAPAPMKCGPKSMFPFTGYWDYSAECNQPWLNPPQTCNAYEGQKAGKENNDAPFANTRGRTDVEGCCWWGRGVIQTTGPCNFGKLNYFLGKRAADEGRPSRYPTIDFCRDPEAICASQEFTELKWIAGMFYWVESVQGYNEGGWDYITELRKFVDGGMTDTGFIDSVSGIVNRGCHNPPCASGPVDGGADRRANFQKVLQVFASNSAPTAPTKPTPTQPMPAAPTVPPTAAPMAPTGSVGTCGNGNRGNGVCNDRSLCCSEWGWCGTSPEHCPTGPNPTTGSIPTTGPNPTNGPVSPAPPSTNPQCPPSGYTLIPSMQCKGFYHCVNGAILGDMVPCPVGTLFNKAVGVCDWPSNVNC